MIRPAQDDGQGHDPAPTEISVNVPICFSNFGNRVFCWSNANSENIQLALTTAWLESLPKISLDKGGKCCELTQSLAN